MEGTLFFLVEGHEARTGLEAPAPEREAYPEGFPFSQGMFLSKAIALRMGAGWGMAEGAEDGDGIRRRRAVRGYEGPPAS